jgi:putative glutathione S-transferase
MGKLVDGKWVVADVATTDEDGSYDRVERSFRETISDEHDRFQPASGRYHLYVSYACPWAHRTLIFRKLKELEAHISVDVVSPDMLENGWKFDPSFPDSTKDSLYDSQYLREIYLKADDQITTTVTVPILWDKEEQTIVNNESADIIRIFNSAFNDITGNDDDYYPEDLRKDIDAWNDKIYPHVNNGVYKAGFAKTQKAYEQAVKDLFRVLDELESHLEDHTYLVGNQLTEADVRLVTTLIRFDPVYYVHFKCSRTKITEFPCLSNYLSIMMDHPAVDQTTHMHHIVRHYYYSHENLNPNRIIPFLDAKLTQKIFASS